MMKEVKMFKISWDCLKGKILVIKKAKKIYQDKKKKDREVLIDICFNKKIVEMLILDLKIYI